MCNDLENSITALEKAIQEVKKQLKDAEIPYSSRALTSQPISIMVIVEKGSITYRSPNEPDENGVSVGINRNQKIQWECVNPFTIYYGANSPITPDDPGKPIDEGRVREIRVTKKTGNDYITPPTYIHRNTLDGAYKYTVSVWDPDTNSICVDDPETIVPRPNGGGIRQ